MCEAASISLNRNTVPGDASALSPGGVRIGTPAMTTRGCTGEDSKKIAEFLDRTCTIAIEIQKEKGKKLTDFEEGVKESKSVQQLSTSSLWGTDILVSESGGVVLTDKNLLFLRHPQEMSVRVRFFIERRLAVFRSRARQNRVVFFCRGIVQGSHVVDPSSIFSSCRDNFILSVISQAHDRLKRHVSAVFWKRVDHIFSGLCCQDVSPQA